MNIVRKILRLLFIELPKQYAILFIGLLYLWSLDACPLPDEFEHWVLTPLLFWLLGYTYNRWFRPPGQDEGIGAYNVAIAVTLDAIRGDLVSDPTGALFWFFAGQLAVAMGFAIWGMRIYDQHARSAVRHYKSMGLLGENHVGLLEVPDLQSVAYMLSHQSTLFRHNLRTFVARENAGRLAEIESKRGRAEKNALDATREKIMSSVRMLLEPLKDRFDSPTEFDRAIEDLFAEQIVLQSETLAIELARAFGKVKQREDCLEGEWIEVAVDGEYTWRLKGPLDATRGEE